MSTRGKYRVIFTNADNGKQGSIKVNAFDADDAIQTARKFLQSLMRNRKIRPTVRTITDVVLVD